MELTSESDEAGAEKKPVRKAVRVGVGPIPAASEIEEEKQEEG